MQSLLNTLDQIGSPRILVLGDLILDRYTIGNAERISPEAPVLVLDADQQQSCLGGAASVASLLRGLGAEVALAGCLGDDAEAEVVKQLLEGQGIEGLILHDSDHPTTSKERFLGKSSGRYPQQILRVDRERAEGLSSALEERLARIVCAQLSDFQNLLISDYAKGVCTPRLLEKVFAAAKEIGIPVLVDPARLVDYSRYRGATVLIPNRVEAALATGRKSLTTEEAIPAGRFLRQVCQAEAVLVKLDRDGMVLVADTTQHIRTTPREVHDVTGAGDMVLAMLGLCAGFSFWESAQLANIAAGLEVQRLGVAQIRRAEIRAELARSCKSGQAESKLVALDEMARLAESYRQNGKRVVLANGCFDLLHVGHASYLQEAAQLGDVLVVAVNSDHSVRALKGPARPVIPQQDRAAMLAALEAVDHVLIFDEDTPHELLRRIRPDVLVKGGTYSTEEVVGREVVEAYGGHVRVTGRLEGVSTTHIVNSLSLREKEKAELIR